MILFTNQHSKVRSLYFPSPLSKLYFCPQFRLEYPYHMEVSQKWGCHKKKSSTFHRDLPLQTMNFETSRFLMGKTSIKFGLQEWTLDILVLFRLFIWDTLDGTPPSICFPRCRQGDHHLPHDARHDRLAGAGIAQEASDRRKLRGSMAVKRR